MFTVDVDFDDVGVKVEDVDGAIEEGRVDVEDRRDVLFEEGLVDEELSE